MKLHDLSPAKGSRKKRKRVGRGPGSGNGKTSCRGSKGQKARSGGGPARGFEGGQMPLQRRLPKRGFTNPFRKEYNVLNVEDLNRFDPNAEVDLLALKEKGLIRKKKDGVKLLANGQMNRPLVIRVQKASKAAREKVEAAGGRIEII
jgi:large subunit ribosomal protein L15